MPWGAVIGAGASLLGGALARKDERKGIREQNAYNHPSAIRARAEEAGFNPLLFIGPNTGTQTTAFQGGQMGQAIVDAGMAVGSAVDRRSQLQKQNEKLQAQNDALVASMGQASRPPIAGVYGNSGTSLTGPLVATQALSDGHLVRGNGIADMDVLDPDFVGPAPVIQVRDTLSGRWMNIDPRLAAQNMLQDGDWITQGAIEEIAGDLVGEGMSVTSAGYGVTNEGGIFGGAFGAPLPVVAPRNGATHLPPIAAPITPPWWDQSEAAQEHRRSFIESRMR